MASAWYNEGKRRILEGTVSLGTDAVKLLLVDTGYVPSVDHDFVSDVSGDELSGTGYAGGFGGSGRRVIGGKVFSTDLVLDRAEFTFDAVTWEGIDAGTAAYAILVQELTTDADSPVLAYLDFPDQVTDGNNLRLTAAAAGVLHLT